MPRGDPAPSSDQTGDRPFCGCVHPPPPSPIPIGHPTQGPLVRLTRATASSRSPYPAAATGIPALSLQGRTVPWKISHGAANGHDQ